MSRSLKENPHLTSQFNFEWKDTDVLDIRGLIRQKEGWLTWNKETERIVIQKAGFHARKFRFHDPDSFVGDVLIHAYRKVSSFKIAHKNGIDCLCRNYAICVTRKKTLNTMSYDALNHSVNDEDSFESIFQDQERDLAEEINTDDVLSEVSKLFPELFLAANMKAEGMSDTAVAKELGMKLQEFREFYEKSQASASAWLEKRHKQ